jgi:hypothetical protein
MHKKNLALARCLPTPTVQHFLNRRFTPALRFVAKLAVKKVSEYSQEEQLMFRCQVHVELHRGLRRS